jgi:8-oxo-dGTP pyrophosphatase MutT (NUDIX family)
MTEADISGNTASLIVLHPETEKLLRVCHPSFRRWMFPGGKIEPDEAPHQAALREVKEEVGLRITIADLSDLPRWQQQGNLRLPQSEASYIDFVFIGVSKTAALWLRREISRANWFDFLRSSDSTRRSRSKRWQQRFLITARRSVRERYRSEVA